MQVARDRAADFAELAAYREAIDAHALVSRADARGRIIHANDKFCEISKYSRGELIGQDHRILNSGHHPREFWETMWRTIRRGEPWHGTIRNRAKDGEHYWVASSIFPLLTDAGLEYLSIRTHVPDLERAKEEAENASRAKSAFLAAISHELRTPMNGVLGAASILSKMNLAAEAQEFVDIISDSGSHLMHLLNDILDILKFQSGKIDLEETEFSLRTIVRKAAAIHSLKSADKGLAFEVGVDPAVWDNRIGDPVRITQLLHNLLSNAVKFTDRGSVRLFVAARLNSRGEDAIEVTVADTGIGMTKGYIAVAFTPFQQADSSITRRFGGTGLGLSIVKNIVDAMRGEIEIDSSAGKGTTIRAWMPLKRALHEAPVPDIAPVSLKLAPQTSILIADDNQTNILVLQAFLRCAGADTVVTLNGAEAVRAFANSQFDIVLLDINMPVMDGETALAEIRRLEYEKSRAPTPVVAVSADALPDQVSRFLRVGFDAHLAKPVNEQALLSVIIGQMQRKSASSRA